MDRPLLALCLFAACAGPAGPKGDPGPGGEKGAPGTACSVEEPEAGVKRIVCSDGTQVEVCDGVDGTDGTNGENGEDGTDAEPCTVTVIEGGARITCPDGSTADVLDGTDGLPGEDGEDGTPGEQGEPGTACSVVEDESGKRVECEDGTSVPLEDGADGKPALVKLSPEPEGENCELGGTKVEAGVDDDRSGVLDEGEVESTTWVCVPVPPPAPACDVFVGFMNIENSADLEAFAQLGCARVEGYVFISGAFRDLSKLAFLREVDDQVWLDDLAGPNIELAGLERVGKGLSVLSMKEELKTLSFPKLKHVGSLTINDAPGLTAFNAPLLEQVEGHVNVVGPVALTSLSGLSSLVAVGGLEVAGAESLTSIGLGSLRRAGSKLAFSDNTALYECLVDELRARVHLAADATTTNEGNLAGCAEGGDLDQDGVVDADDNCPYVANPEQENSGGTQAGDACDAQPPTPGQLVLNELHVDPAGGAPTNPQNALGDANADGTRDSKQDEFVEIVNAASVPLDLSGVQLLTRNSSDTTRPLAVRYTFPAGTVLAPGKAAVIFGGGAPRGLFGGAWLATATDTASGVGLANSRDVVRLLSNGTAIDEVAYDSSELSISGESRQRSPDVTGTAFVPHRQLAGGTVRFSPGTRVDGSAF